MFRKDVPLTAKVSLALSVMQIAAWPLFEYLWVTDEPLVGPSTLVTSISDNVSAMIFVLLTLPNLGLIVWEMLIAFRTKRHFWLMYALAAIVLLMWVITFTFHPFAPARRCGCTVY